MKKILLITFLVLIIGSAGLVSVLIESHLEKQQIESKNKTSQELRNELANTLPDQQQLISQVQQEMLAIDLPQLAAGKKSADSHAENIYGKGWRDEVAKYKKRKEIFNALSTVSIVLVMTAVMVLVAASLHDLLSRLKKKYSSKSSDEIQVEQEQENVTQEQENTKPKEPLVKADPEADEKNNNLEHLQAAGLSSVDVRQNVKGIGKPMGSFALADKEQASTMMSTEPVTQSLTDLTEQVSAIREFASQQQDRVKQLQDGYDWTIVKRFCIRIIRCIDNLDDSITNLEKAGEETMHLENVRDELIFALESSGVEQFQPETNTDYKGMEKTAEAVSKREKTDDQNLAGKIASIVRPGYQYVVSDDDIKVVRSAQVMLYIASSKKCVGAVK